MSRTQSGLAFAVIAAAFSPAPAPAHGSRGATSEDVAPAATASHRSHTFYVPTVQTGSLDVTAREVIRAQSHWVGSYAEARRALLQLGWRPDPKADCMGSINGGDDPEAFCRSHPQLEDCLACRATPELTGCSLGPIEQCLEDFVNPASSLVLEITTTGEHHDDRVIESLTFLGKSFAR